MSRLWIPNSKSASLRRAKRWDDFTSFMWAQIQQHCKIYVNLFEIHNYLIVISISAHSLVNFWCISSSSLMPDGRINCTKAKETGHICSFEWTRRLKVPDGASWRVLRVNAWWICQLWSSVENSKALVYIKSEVCIGALRVWRKLRNS